MSDSSAVMKDLDHLQVKRTFAARSRLRLSLITWLIVLAIAVYVGFSLDQTVQAALDTHQWASLKRFARLVSTYGDWPELMSLGLLLTGFLWFIRRRSLIRLVVCMMAAATLAGAAVNSVRIFSGRARPNNTEVPPGWYGIRHDDQFVLFKNKFHSFPSGHTACAFAFFGVLGFALKKWGWSALVLAGLIGWSRLYLNVHFFSDVVVGATVGLLSAQCVLVFFSVNRIQAGDSLQRFR